MITVDIEICYDTPSEEVQRILENFPYNHVDHRHEYKPGTARDDNAHLLIELAQSSLTIEQERYLNQDEYIDLFTVNERKHIDGTSLDEIITNVIHDLLKPIRAAYSNNGRQVYYLEDDYDQTILSLVHKGTVLQQIQCGDTTAKVALTQKDTDRILAILLQHKIELAREDQSVVETSDEQEDHIF